MSVKLGMTQNKIIGLIGGSGCGKSLLCTAASELGYTVIDGDGISHEVLQKDAYDEIVSAFGEGVLLPDKTVSRAAVGKIVFGNPEALDTLNKIMHKHILRRMRMMMTDRCIIDAAVLHKTELIRECTCVIAVVADDDVRIGRITERDGITRTAAKQRISAQPTNGQYEKIADIVIENNGSEQEFLNKARECLQSL